MKKVKNFDYSVFVLALFCCLLWSTGVVGVKIGLKYAKPLTLAGVRFILAGILLLPLCKNPVSLIKSIRENIKMITILSIFQTFLLYSLFFTGMTLITGAIAAIIIGSSPLFAAITAHLFMHDDKMNIKKTMTLMIGITGIIIISINRQPWSLQGFREFIGIILLIIGCIGSAIGNIIVAKYKRKINPIHVNSAQMFMGGILLLLVSIPLEGVLDIEYSTEFFIALIWLSLISAIAFSIWFYLLKKSDTKVSELNVWKFIIPVSGTLLSWLILPDESASLVIVIGMVLVAVSVLSFNLVSMRLQK